jgi:hypothetical protein
MQSGTIWKKCFWTIRECWKGNSTWKWKASSYGTLKISNYLNHLVLQNNNLHIFRYLLKFKMFSGSYASLSFPFLLCHLLLPLSSLLGFFLTTEALETKSGLNDCYIYDDTQNLYWYQASQWPLTWPPTDGMELDNVKCTSQEKLSQWETGSAQTLLIHLKLWELVKADCRNKGQLSQWGKPCQGGFTMWNKFFIGGEKTNL